MKIPKPKYGWTYLIARILTGVTLAISIANTVIEPSAWGPAWLGVSLGFLAHAKLTRLERLAKPKVLNYTPSTPEQVEEFKRHLKEDLQRQATRWV